MPKAHRMGKRSGNAPRRSIATAILCAALTAMLLLPSVSIALEADHDCDGGDCVACQCIQAAEGVLHSIGSDSGSAAMPFALALFVVALLLVASFAAGASSLVHQKVRLNI